MSSNRWPTATAEQPCPACGHATRCRVAPDGTAAVCWRGDGKVIQCGTRPADSGTGYVGAAHRPKLSGKPAKVYPTPEAAVEAAARSIPGGGTLANVWAYRDARGTDAMRVARFDLADGGKQFRPVHPTPDGWRIGDPPGPLPLYRLDELPAAGPVHVCEGEKCCDAARRIGLPATTSAHGASAAAKSDWTPLAGRDVVIIPDADEPGRRYARNVATILAKLDPPARVKIVELPGLPEGGDVVEYIDARDCQDAEEIAAGIITLADAAAPVVTADLIGGPVLTCMADVQPRAIEWLWPGRAPLGRITLLVGRPGEGKSFLTIDMTARVTRGTPWPDGSACPAGSVILITAEDDPGDTIRPRLDAHGANCRRVHLLPMVRHIEDGKAHDELFTLAHVAELEDSLKQHPDCRLVVVDPIGSFLGGGTDAHRDNEVRSVLAPVARLAEKYGVAVLVVAHRRKSAGTSADDLALGSRAFTGIARAVWHLSRDKENPARRLLLPGKNNLAPEGDGLAFTIQGEPACIAWEREPVRMSADDALAVENGEGGKRPGPEPDARKAAAGWLRKLLAAGEMEAAKVKAEATAAELAWRTVQRAADDLGVIREKNAFSGGWQWRLPKPATEDENGRANQRATLPKEKELGILASSGHQPENEPFDMPPDQDAKFKYLGISADELRRKAMNREPLDEQSLMARGEESALSVDYQTTIRENEGRGAKIKDSGGPNPPRRG